MIEKLAVLEEKYEELSHSLGDASLIAQPEKYQRVAKAHAELQGIVDRYRQVKALSKEIVGTETILDEERDEEILSLAREELQGLKKLKTHHEKELELLLRPKDPDDEKNVILEIRAGTGGSEATLFSHEMFRMYSRYAERQNWKVEVVSVNHSGVGGLKEIVATIEGKGVYGRLKYESGVHRVQRVPETEAQGRVHTSAVTVAILPEAEELEVAIDLKDLRIDTFCSSGPGGQSVNTTYSAVRISHIPSGEVVTCQDEKSQLKNKAKAMKVLRSRLYDKALQQQQSEIAKTRRSLVGSGDRSEKIRTYNFPQNRVTDHRLNLTLHQLEQIKEGGLDPLVDALITFDRTEALKRPEGHLKSGASQSRCRDG